MNVRKLLAAHIRKLRRARDFSQENLAEMSGFSLEGISKIERGLSTPTLDSLLRISDALGVSLEELLAPLLYQDNQKTTGEKARLIEHLASVAQELDTKKLKIALEQIKALSRK